jgi:uncharacterized protein
MIESLFEIKKYKFEKSSLSEIDKNHFVSGLWPLVYILSDGETNEAYVGETTDALNRMASHLNNGSKNTLTAVHLITSDRFNKSATLDIESNLIKYIHGDGKYKLLNGNLGLANHTYYEKNEVYWGIFQSVWDELKQEGITINSLEKINNSDLFKYSPYKSLTVDQKNSLIQIIDCLIDDKISTIIIEGGAGTGKTILAIFLFALLNTDISSMNLNEFGTDELPFIAKIKTLKQIYPNPKMALVVPMAGFRSTLKKVFKNIKGLNANMVIGPAEIANQKYDITIVDESHRLRKRVNLGAYFGAYDKVNLKLKLDKFDSNELDWVKLQSKKSILFYDENQSIKPSDIDKNSFNKLRNKESTVVKKLKSQFRVKGGDDYVSFINKILECNFQIYDTKFLYNNYDFLIFDSIKDMIDEIKLKDKRFGLSRLIAGYSWEWVSKNSDKHDIEIDNVQLKWNSVDKDWVNSENSVNEVGCIHTTQGYDLNYSGIIFGNEISYDKIHNKIIINKEKYHDKLGKQSIENPEILKSYIINIYKTMMLRGIKGTYVYACDKDLRDYLKRHISIFEKIEQIEPIQIQFKTRDYFETIDLPILEKVAIPMYETVGCGQLMYADSTVQDMINIPKNFISSGSKYFILRTSGDSMNKIGISDGDLVLCKKNYQPEIGSNVIALIGDDATVKVLRKENGELTLQPNSTNPKHKPIIIDQTLDVKFQGVFVRVLKKEDLD